jgi:amino acid transporter
MSRKQAGGFVGWGAEDSVFLAKDRKGRLVSAAGERDEDSNNHKDDEKDDAKHGAKLGPLLSTSIAGNDLLSSCLYTAGICAGYAGKAAPLSLLLVSFMLYFFRFVYAEVVTAIPINGGSYTALSNTTSKRLASIAACLSVISYIATAVVSAESAVLYVALLFPNSGIADPQTNACGYLCQGSTIGVLGVFAALNLLGISESANVAAIMFVVHVIALTILVVWSLVWGILDGFSLFRQNLNTDYPSGASFPVALYFGYASALLGITGFETAANYVEEMKDSKTYVTTLRNMWVSVAFFNPVIGVLAMTVLPMDKIYTYTSNLLGPMADVVGGPYLEAFICIDGAIVLAGSVLTAYVGIGGLIQRMAQDRCLPSFILAKNSLRGTNHWIILGFFGVASSLVIALDGDVDMLGSVYNIAFLSVMTAFAMSCVVLKWKRPQLPRMVVASGPVVALALVFVIAGLIGNIIRDPTVLAWFLLYFGVVAFIVLIMFSRTTILKACLTLAQSFLATGKDLEQIEIGRKRIMESHEYLESQLSDPSRPREGHVVAVDLHQDSPTAFDDTSRGMRVKFAGENDDEEDGGDFDDYEQDFDAEVQSGSSSVFEEREENVVSSRSRNPPNSPSLLQDRVSSPVKRTWRESVSNRISKWLHDINSQPCVYFSKAPDFETLNKAVLYVRTNEQTSRLIVVHVVDDSEAVLSARNKWSSSNAGAASPTTPDFRSLAAILEETLPPLSEEIVLLREQVRVLDAVYPKLRIDFLVVRGTVFGPAVCSWLGRKLKIGNNMMFMSSPDFKTDHRFAALGGVRVITRASGRRVRKEGARRTVEVLTSAGRALSHSH